LKKALAGKQADILTLWNPSVRADYTTNVFQWRIGTGIMQTGG
jgi:hypothetical protein